MTTTPAALLTPTQLDAETFALLARRRNLNTDEENRYAELSAERVNRLPSFVETGPGFGWSPR